MILFTGHKTKGMWWFRFGFTGYGFSWTNYKTFPFVTFSYRMGGSRGKKIGCWYFEILKPFKRIYPYRVKNLR